MSKWKRSLNRALANRRRAATFEQAVTDPRQFRLSFDAGSDPGFRSLEQARSLGAEYEVALTLKALADTGLASEGDSAGESQAIMGSLGVVSVPSPPLP